MSASNECSLGKLQEGLTGEKYVWGTKNDVKQGQEHSRQKDWPEQNKQ